MKNKHVKLLKSTNLDDLEFYINKLDHNEWVMFSLNTTQSLSLVIYVATLVRPPGYFEEQPDFSVRTPKMVAQIEGTKL
jgi:hypothetical protein